MTTHTVIGKMTCCAYREQGSTGIMLNHDIIGNCATSGSAQCAKYYTHNHAAGLQYH